MELARKHRPSLFLIFTMITQCFGHAIIKNRGSSKLPYTAQQDVNNKSRNSPAPNNTMALICSLPPDLICLESLNILLKRKEKNDLRIMYANTRNAEHSSSGVDYDKIKNGTLDNRQGRCTHWVSGQKLILQNFQQWLSSDNAEKHAPDEYTFYVDVARVQRQLNCNQFSTVFGVRNRRKVLSKRIERAHRRIERSTMNTSNNGSTGNTICMGYWKGDGFCDLGCNTAEFKYDDGDCCYDTCIEKLRRYPCGYTGFQCVSKRNGVPSWAYGIQICFRWRSTGDAAQCNSRPRGEMCAAIGSMTKYYNDDTDSRIGGCKLAWKLKAESIIPKWFNDSLKICFATHAAGNGWQCNGGKTNTHSCIPMNRWLEYMDDTDDRSGGCYMSWKLQYIGIVPSWAKTMKLCFYWHSSSKQCGMYGAGNNNCAGLNAWTTSYKDSTDRRTGGCEMAWGILM
eukprot:gene12953-14283_t